MGDAQDEVRRRYRDRLVAAVESRSALERVLCDLSEGLVTCVGPWPTLTVGVSEVLAEWAAENPARGCGVLPLWPKPRGQSLQPTRSQAERSTVALLWSGTELFDGGFVSPEGYQRASEQAVCRAVTSAHPPIAAAATGHGAEHCIRFGSRWLVSDQRLAPPGDTFPPARIGCPVVFLNCCSSARLGDCGIPQRYSLAATLGRRGKAVIGSFRNLHAVPQAGVEFARTLLSGTPLGQVVNAVNRASASWGESRPTFQLIGDAAQSWCAPAEAGALERPHPVVAAQLLLPLSLAWLDKLVATLCHWRTLGDGVQKAHGNMLAAERALCMAKQPAARVALSDDQVGLLGEVARECCAVLAEEILKQFVADITDEWLDAWYGPLCWPRTETAMTCRRCAGSGRRVWYPPCRAAFIGVAREECDGCGTVCEQLGDCPPRRPIRATVAAGRLTVTLPALDPSASGYVFVRKNPGAAPLPWPSGGGKVAFDLHALARRGRVTAAAVAVGDQWLEVDYHTIFVPL